MGLCPYCGKQIEEKAKKCCHCGEYLKLFSYLLSKKKLFFSYFISMSIPYGLITYLIRGPDKRNLVTTSITSIIFGFIMSIFFILFYHKRKMIQSATLKKGDINKFEYPKSHRRLIAFGFILWPFFIIGGFFAYKYNLINPRLYHLVLYIFSFAILLNVLGWYEISLCIITNDIGITAQYLFKKQMQIKWDEVISIESPRSYGIKSRKDTRIIRSCDPKKKIEFAVQIEGYPILIKKIKDRAPTIKIND